MIGAGLATDAEQAIFDLDFHAIMHWGEDLALEKHYVPRRSQRTRSVLTFFAQDCGTHTLVYANADLAKATQSREVLAFADHWKTPDRPRPGHAGHGPEGHHPARPRRTRRPRHHVPHPADALTRPDPTDRRACPPPTTRRSPWTGTGAYSRPKRRRATGVKLTNYPTTVRQLIVTGLGRDAPTVIITNDRTPPPSSSSSATPGG